MMGDSKIGFVTVFWIVFCRIPDVELVLCGVGKVLACGLEKGVVQAAKQKHG